MQDKVTAAANQSDTNL
ncbi:unnamed protein product, partial [Rotaria magnacalcarata]